jgi:hypothetical protein
MIYTIKVRVFLCFWSTFKVKKHWIETKLNNDPIPARLCIIDENDDIVIVSNILFRDWSIKNGNKKSLPRNGSVLQIFRSKCDVSEPVFQPNAATTESGSSSTTTDDATNGSSSGTTESR